MENPAHWTEAERIISAALSQHDRDMKSGMVGCSLVHTIYKALVEEGMILEGVRPRDIAYWPKFPTSTTKRMAENTLEGIFTRPGMYASTPEGIESSVLIHMSYMFNDLDIYEAYRKSKQKQALDCGAFYPSGYYQAKINGKEMTLSEAMDAMHKLLKGFYEDVKANANTMPCILCRKPASEHTPKCP